MLVVLLTLTICCAFGQNGEFEGSTDPGLGVDRGIDYTGDVEVTYTTTGMGGGKRAGCFRVTLPQLGLDFKGNIFTKGYICANGLVKFREGSYELSPRNFGTYDGQETGEACLAPYWSFVDLDYFDSGDSKVFYRKYDDPNSDYRKVFEKATDYGNKILDISNYRPSWVMVVTWLNLRPKQGIATYEGKNTFQLFLASGSSGAISVYLYTDIDWAVGVPRVDYGNYLRSNVLPVVGYNSAQPEDDFPAAIYAESGTINVEGVDDFEGDPALQERGFIGYDLRKTRPPTSAELCRTWVTEQSRTGRVRSSCRRSCPPTLSLARFALRGRFYSLYHREKNRNFFTPNYCIFSATWGRLDADECCYSYFGPPLGYYLSLIFRSYFGFFLQSSPSIGSGRWHPYHPFRNFRLYQEDEDAYRMCCTEADSTEQSCSEFYSIRPVCNSNFWFFPTRWAWMFGDPHFVSLDGKNYTFNGCGWFTYFKGDIPGNNESSLVVQVRTTKVGNVNATGFTGIAIKEGNAEVVQVNLMPGGGFIVRVNGSDYIPGTEATTLESGITLSFNGSFEIGTPLGSGVQIKEAANGTFFTFVTAFLSSYENSSIGLSGKWNGNMEDDFTLPDGTVLPIGLNDSEIFYQFGEKWRVKDNETIYENINDDDAAYKCPSGFEPIFFDQALAEMSSDLREQAERVCGNDVTCLFDIAATNDVAIGRATLSEVTTINQEVAEVVNRLPTFTQNISVINVTLGETFILELEANDPDGDELTFEAPILPPGANFTASGSQLIFYWPVQSAETANLTILVQDTKNGSATFSPRIQLCRCENGGQCFVPEASSEETERIKNAFLIMSCDCPFGFTGEFCGDVKDFCDGGLTPPCNALVTCTNSPGSFICGACPNGYTGDGQTCADIDECTTDPAVCDQICTNTVSSYFCRCNDGFSLQLDGKTCRDIDECSQANDCSQLCNNTVGSYECYCKVGFLIKPDNPNSCTAQTECSQSNECSQICYIDPVQVGQEKCDCNQGYRLGTDMKTCEDINECGNSQDNLCAQLCTNTEGSYTCSCREGYERQGSTGCTDINECVTGDYTCNGIGEECENNAGSYGCACSKKLNMIRVNGTCIFREDPNIMADLAPDPPAATNEQTSNAVQVTLSDFQKVNYTVDADQLFKESVVKVLNDFCNENQLRPQDCGVSQNQLLFNLFNFNRLPGYPTNQGNNAIIKFYVDYPSNIRNGTVSQAILASIVSANLQKLQGLTGFSITLDTSVTPPSPGVASAVQQDNAVELEIASFSQSQWTTFYDTIFRRAVALTLNKYCDVDTNLRTEDCKLSASESFGSENVTRLPNYPSDNGENVQVSFYVNHPSKSEPVSKLVLASMLVIRKADLESALSQQIVIQTSASPVAPPTATSEQTNNSVVIRISSFAASQWTHLNDLRLRNSIATRVAAYCGGKPVDCQIQTGLSSSFSVSDVERSSAGTPSDSVDNSIDYSFYVKYPGSNNSIIQYILASVIKIESDAIQSESNLFFSLQTSFKPLPPANPTSDQENNTVAIEILNQKADQWHGIQDNRLRATIAAQVANYCSSNLVICGVTSDQVSFDLSHVTRIESSPVQVGNNVTYNLFVDYPSGNGPIQRNLLAGILTIQIEMIKNGTSLDMSVLTSTLAATPHTANSEQMSNAIVVSVSGIQADQWSAIEDNRFRGYVAQAISEYCRANVECNLPTNDASFTTSHVQLVQGYPNQDGNVQFYVKYPGSGTIMSQAILLLIITEQQASIQTNTKLQFTIETTIEIPTIPPPSPENEDNAITIVLTNYQADEWPLRDELFRKNMAKEITAFCKMTKYHGDICNISEADVNGFTADNIKRLPGSPMQEGNNSILSFYASLPSGSGSLARTVLATIFTTQQEKILSLNSELQNANDSISSSETPVLSNEQNQNIVPITIFSFEPKKVTTLVVIDIRVTVAKRMTIFCFSTPGNICGLTTITARRKKRASPEFRENDVLVDTNSIMDAGNNTVLGVVVNEPGTSTPVQSSIVQDGLHETIQEDAQSDISNLTLGIANVPTVSEEQRDDAISVRLTDSQASQWTLQQDISFRNNMSQAIVQFCSMNDVRLATCNLTREQLNDIDFQNIQILPDSPTQDGNDSVLSFFVNLPNGRTMPSELLSIIYSQSPSIISQPTTVNMTATSQNPDLTSEQIENLVSLTVTGQDPSQDVRLDVKVTIADRLNSYCRNNSGSAICPTNNTFSQEDVLVKIDNNGSVSFVVIDPNDKNSTFPAALVEDAISGDFPSKLLKGLTYSVSKPTTIDDDSEIDWPLILGLSIAGALLFLAVIVSIIIGVANQSSETKFKEYDLSERESVYSARGWQFDRQSPYSGSPFASIDAIPGFDEDGLPSDNRAIDTNV